MTEKRFKDGQGEISVVGENLIFKLLCVIAEENQELRTKNNDCLRHIEVYKEKNNHLKLENEQLKADKQALIDFIRKEFPKSYEHILEGF